ncbi:MAG: ABC transporter permease [Candidatus Marinimicrobia bacterium]|nr:ABC transporter permease [Candidatus Neomarinimicrobiota bacterium]
MKPGRIPRATLILVLLFFYGPILILAVSSFNASRFGGSWDGFSLRWYRQLFHDRAVWDALRNTLIVALVSTTAAMGLGTTAAFALHRYRSRLQLWHYGLVYAPLVIPDILMGMSLLLFFVSLRLPLGLLSITLAHITFCISYVAMVVLARLQDFDFSLIEAALDLGASRWTAIRHVLLPLLAPGVLAGGLLAFTLSVDDFVITFFVAGPGSTTLPIYIYSMIKHGSPPMINALSVILLALTFIVVMLSQHLTEKRT